VPKNLEEWDHRWQGVSIPTADWHFHRRLFQRYNSCVLPPGAYSEMLNCIRTEHRRAYILRQRDDRHAIWAVWVRDLSSGRLTYIVYDARAQRAVTALPHSAQLRKLYQRARALKAAPQRAAEALGERETATMNLSALTP
jgi:hypothetical protein